MISSLRRVDPASCLQLPPSISSYVAQSIITTSAVYRPVGLVPTFLWSETTHTDRFLVLHQASANVTMWDLSTTGHNCNPVGISCGILLPARSLRMEEESTFPPSVNFVHTSFFHFIYTCFLTFPRFLSSSQVLTYIYKKNEKTKWEDFSMNERNNTLRGGGRRISNYRCNKKKELEEKKRRRMEICRTVVAEYTLAMLCFRFFITSVPSYFSDLPTQYTLSR